MYRNIMQTEHCKKLAEDPGYMKDNWEHIKSTIMQCVQDYQYEFEVNQIELELEGLEFAGKVRETYLKRLEYHYDEYIDEENRSIIPIQAVFMLTNDYTGGDLYFKNQDLTISFKPGDLVIFPANFLFIHKITPFDGNRIACYPTFYDKRIEKCNVS